MVLFSEIKNAEGPTGLWEGAECSSWDMLCFKVLCNTVLWKQVLVPIQALEFLVLRF